MDKDFTDFLLWVYGGGDRVRHVTHLRNKKGLAWRQSKLFPKKGGSDKPFGYDLFLDLDRSYRIKWNPWKKLDWKRPWWALNELFRSKKVGILFYQEQCSGQCGNCLHKKDDKCNEMPKILYPMHISKIHQPGGEMR